MGELRDSVTVLDLGISWDSSVGTVSRLHAGRQRSQRFIPGTGKRFYLFQNVQTGPGFNPASYIMGTRGRFHGGNAAEA
jgi:hypothetical protein